LGYLIARALYLGPNTMNVPGATLGFAPLSILRSFGIFLLDLPGVYLNEQHFVGMTPSHIALPVKLAQAGFLLANVLGLCLYFWSRRVTFRSKLECGLLSALALTLLVPPSLIHKHDLRYVVASLMAYLLVLARVVPAIVGSSRALAVLAVTLIAGYAAGTGVYFRRHMDGLYYVVGSRVAESAKVLTIDRFGQSLRNFRLAIPAGAGIDWALLNGELFRVYLNDPHYQVLRYSKLEEIDPINDTPLLVLACPTDHCEDVTIFALEERAEQNRLRFDAVRRFEEGEVEPNAVVSTPTGRGVFVGVLDDGTGAQHTLTVVSGFHYRSSAIPLERGDELCIRYRMPYAQSDGAGLRIKAVTVGAARLLLDDAALKPKPQWDRRCLDLSSLAGRQVKIDVEVYSPSGDPIADCVTFGRFSVLRALDSTRSATTVR
jgi:hypothetical protein